LMKSIGRLPVDPGGFWKKTCPANGAVPSGLAPRMVRPVHPAGSAWVRLMTVDAPPQLAVASNTLGLIKKIPFGVLKTPIRLLIWLVDNVEVAGCRAERPARLSVPRGSRTDVGSPVLIFTIEVNWKPPKTLLATPLLSHRRPLPNGNSQIVLAL